MTRRLCLGLIPVPLAAGLALLALAHPIRLAATAAVTMTLLLLLAAMAASRAFGDTAGAVLFGGMSIGYAGLAGALVPVLATAGNAGGAPVGAPLGATGVARPAFLAVGIGALLAGGGTTVAAVAQASPAGAAGVLLLLVLPLGAFVPVFAARLARLRLPPLPTTPEELQAEIDPEPSTQVLARTAAADRYMTALYGALGVVGAGCLAVLALAGQGTPARLLTTVAITLLALHARVMAGARQRLAALIPAVFGSALLVVSAAAGATPAVRLTVVGGLVAAAGLLYAGAHTLAGRRMLPYWGRIGDLAQTACSLALLPLVLWVLDVYRYARGLGG
jgi:type VII secretion integral membrane protein EccD